LLLPDPLAAAADLIAAAAATDGSLSGASGS
jgi:hypothetical protein